MLGGSAAAAGLTQISVIGRRFVRCGRGHYLATQRTYLPPSLSRVYPRNDVWDWPAEGPVRPALPPPPLIQHIWGAAQRSWGELQHPGEQHSQHKESDPTALMSVVSLAHNISAFSPPRCLTNKLPRQVHGSIAIYRAPSKELRCFFPWSTWWLMLPSTVGAKSVYPTRQQQIRHILSHCVLKMNYRK